MNAKLARPRIYLMCPPEYFTVKYSINAWMDPTVHIDPALAYKQWKELKDLYERLGHTVHVLDPEPGLPDMVFAANGAFTLDGIVYGAKFKYPQRAPEAAIHLAWFKARGWRDVVVPSFITEGEGDFSYLPGRELIVAGYGFRTELAAHAEAQDVFGHPVVSLHLVDERFYHLDTALFVLDDDEICYFPDAFSVGSQRALQELFPQALIATEADARTFGLNAISDGRHVILPDHASRLADELAARGYEPIPIDLSELLKAGGHAKCCTAELRASEVSGV